jgi:hypothetical protein
MIQPARRQAAMPIKPGTPPDMVAMKVVLVDCLIYRGLPRSRRRHTAPSSDRDLSATNRMKKAQ